MHSDLPRVDVRGGGGGPGVPPLAHRQARAQPHQQAQEAEAEGQGLQEGRRRPQREECDGGLQSQGKRSQEDDEMTQRKKIFSFLEIQFV